MHLVVVGCTVVDVIFRELSRLPAWPQHTEFTAANLVQPGCAPIVTLGGNGANAAYVAASSGVHVTLHTSIGSDSLGQLARGWLRDVGCEVRAGRGAGATAMNVTIANQQHRRASVFYAGAPVRLPRLSAQECPAGATLVCGWPHPPLAEIAREFAALHRRGELTAFDPGPLLSEPWSLPELRPVLSHLDVLLANDHELGSLARAPDRTTALRRFRECFSGHIVLKCGRDGAVWLPAGENRPRAFRARAVRVANTVGAGDTFNGALLAALLQRRPMPQAIALANRMAARVVASPYGVLGASARKAAARGGAQGARFGGGRRPLSSRRRVACAGSAARLSVSSKFPPS